MTLQQSLEASITQEERKSQMDTRTEFIAGLRKIAEFLEAHPELPVDQMDFDNYALVKPENYFTVLRSLPSPAIDPCPAHAIFYITQSFGPVRLRWIQKKKGIFEPQIINGEVKWVAPEDPEELRAQRDTLEVLGKAMEEERTR